MNEAPASRGAFGQARACAERRLSADPKEAASYMLLALALTYLDQPHAAAEALEKGLNIDPKLDVDVAAALAASRKDDEALARLEVAIEKGYNNYVWIMLNPEFQRFKGNPRFEALLKAHLKGMGDRRWE